METSNIFLALGVPFRLHFGALFGVLGAALGTSGTHLGEKAA